jgi:hypothetical protein
MKKLSVLIGIAALATGVASAQTTIFHETFSGASPNWTMIGTPTGIAGSSLTFDGSDGSPAGSYNLNAGPLVGPDFVGFRYQVSGLDFGLGPVTVSFDGRIPSLIAAATHVRINGDFNGAIMGSFNSSTWTTWSKTYALAPGFNATSTLTIDFEFGLGAINPTGGIWEIDNIIVKTTVVPEPSTFALAGLGAAALLLRRRK